MKYSLPKPSSVNSAKGAIGSNRPAQVFQHTSGDSSGSTPEDRHPVYKRLKRLITDYEVPFGEQLIISDIADVLGVSNTPVREALYWLYADGLLTLIPNKGFYTKTLCIDEVLQGIALEIALLQFSAKIVLSNQKLRPHHSLDQPKELKCHCSSDPADTGDLLERFERGLLKEAGNREGIRSMERILDGVRYLRARQLQQDSVNAGVRLHLGRIYVAMHNGDSQETSKLLDSLHELLELGIEATVNQTILKRYKVQGQNAL